MSSKPGSDLESYVMWDMDLIVGDDAGANPSLQIAEAMGVTTRRIRITEEQFAPLLALYELFRFDVEYRLSEFDEDNQSWRDYAGCAFDFLPDEMLSAARKLREELAAQQPRQ